MAKKIEIVERPHLLMVYGTLMRGQGNDVILERTNCLYQGDCITRDLFILADGGFPRLANIPPGPRHKLEPHIGNVRGELWCLTDAGLEACDRLEGHPKFYRRTEVEVYPVDAGSITRKAWLYVIVNYPKGSPLIHTADDGTLTWRGPALDRHIVRESAS